MWYDTCKLVVEKTTKDFCFTKITIENRNES